MYQYSTQVLSLDVHGPGGLSFPSAQHLSMRYRLVTHRLPPQRDSCLKRLCHFFPPILPPQQLLSSNHTRSDILQRY
ncbi:uncharacterized protein N7479_000939 [Penicillium vulpinum]|uniref:uncharacterized protein n=1 Tax=Penicillium vulpinum TaxID=29845 RepID=UPI002547D7AE|nr:uncharacterized protein N7479_000939 [Penicillium vulpinum]KAJ5971021.1 hypothetical protein N7479_000939 [Penicillium vulpinum]